MSHYPTIYLSNARAWIFGAVAMLLVIAGGILVSRYYIFERPHRGTDDVTVSAALSIVNFHDAGILRMRGLSNFEPPGLALKKEPKHSWLYISYPPLWNVVPYLVHVPFALAAPALLDLDNVLYFVRFYNLLLNRVVFLVLFYALFLAIFSLALRRADALCVVFAALFVVVPLSLHPMFLYFTQNIYFVDLAVLLPVTLMGLLFLSSEAKRTSCSFLALAFIAAFFASGTEWLGVLVAVALGVFELLRTGGKISRYVCAHFAGMLMALGLYSAQLAWYPNGFAQLMGRFLQRAALDGGKIVSFHQMLAATLTFFNHTIPGVYGAQLLLLPGAALALAFLFSLAKEEGVRGKTFLLLTTLFFAPIIHALVLKEHYVSFTLGRAKLLLVLSVMLASIPYFWLKYASRLRVHGIVLAAAVLAITISSAWALPSRFRATVNEDQLISFRRGLSVLAFTLRDHFSNDHLVVSRSNHFDQNSLLPVFHLRNFVYNTHIFAWLYKNDRFDPALVKENSPVLLVFENNAREMRCALSLCGSEHEFMKKNRLMFCRGHVAALLKASACLND